MGIARTNCYIICESGGSGADVDVVDLPTHLANLTAINGNQFATLFLKYSNTDFVSGVRVCYKTESYPANPEDGDYIDTDGTPESVKISGLANSTTYYFRVFLYRVVSNKKYFQTDIINAEISAMPNSVTIVGETATVETGYDETYKLNYAKITTSGTFTISSESEIPITAYLIGGGQAGGDHTYYNNNPDDGYDYGFAGGRGGRGGYFAQVNINSISGTITDTANIEAALAHSDNPSGSMLIHNGTTYRWSNTSIENRWFRIGGQGYSCKNLNDSYTIEDATAGVDGISILGTYYASSGGGGAYSSETIMQGGIGAGSGGRDTSNGSPATNYGCGGGGAGCYSGYYSNVGGLGKQGIIILTWE